MLDTGCKALQCQSLKESITLLNSTALAAASRIPCALLPACVTHLYMVHAYDSLLAPSPPNQSHPLQPNAPPTPLRRHATQHAVRVMIHVWILHVQLDVRLYASQILFVQWFPFVQNCAPCIRIPTGRTCWQKSCNVLKRS